jgi:hypothetical protein
MVSAGSVASFAIVVAFGEWGSGVARDPHRGEEDFVRRFLAALAVTGHALLDALRVFQFLCGFLFFGGEGRPRGDEAKQQHQENSRRPKNFKVSRELLHVLLALPSCRRAPFCFVIKRSSNED